MMFIGMKDGHDILLKAGGEVLLANRKPDFFKGIFDSSSLAGRGPFCVSCRRKGGMGEDWLAGGEEGGSPFSLRG